MKLSDFDGEGFVVLDKDGYQTVEIEDVEYYNNPGEKVEIIIKNGDSYEYVRRIISNRKQLPAFVPRSAREETTKARGIESLSLIKTKENLFKKLKSTIIKFSGDKYFPYRQVAETIKDKPFVSEINLDESKIDSVDYLNEEMITDFIISQCIYSLENYTMIHPKVKVLMNAMGKESVLSLSFETEE